MKKYCFSDTSNVCVGDVVGFNGLIVEVTEKLILDNPNLFKELPNPKYFKCIQSCFQYYTVGKIYKHTDNYEYFPRLINLLDDKSSERLIGDWTNDYLSVGNNCFEPVTEEEFIEYEKIQIIEEAKKLFPVGKRVSNFNINLNCTFNITGDKFKWYGKVLLIDGESTETGCTYTVRSYDGIWAEVMKPILKTEDGVDIYEHDHYYTMDMIQGLDASISITNDSVIPYVAGRRYFSSRKAAKEWLDKHFLKNLSTYENSLFEKNLPIKSVVDGIEVVSSRALFYNIMKHREPKLYWNKVMQLIADDLNGDWVVKDSCEKWMIGKREANSWKPVPVKHTTVTYTDVYFKSQEIAEKAMKIIGKNLNEIYK